MGVAALEPLEDIGQRFVLIGTPVGHSLSPVMHNAVYRAADVDWFYKAIECPTTEEALHEIALVRTGRYRGMNITMPYKRLAMEQADVVDASAKAAGGANVLVRRGYELYAYNTDGMGAAGAIAREGRISLAGKHVAVCGTGPTSMAIACAIAVAGAASIIIFSRDEAKAAAAIERLKDALTAQQAAVLRPSNYDLAWQKVPGLDVFVDATPRGMQPDDEPIVDPALFREGQVVMDVVYGHGVTKLLEGASEQGAVVLDGLEMLVEQAALAIEIWQDALGYEFKIDRDLMRGPVLKK